MVRSIIFLISLSCFMLSGAKAQNITIDEPSLRVTCSPGTTVTTAWQDINFNGTVDTVNYYGVDPSTGKKFAWYDSSTNLFKFSGNYDKNIWLQLGFQTTVTSISVKSTFQFRIVVPNGVSPGVDRYLPMSFASGLADAFDATLLNAQAQSSVVAPLMIRVGSGIRANGFKIQVRLRNTLTLGTCTLNSASATISSRY